MSNTYSQIYIHLVFAVKYRQSLINESWETELYKYINGVIQNKGQLPLAIICLIGFLKNRYDSDGVDLNLVGVVVNRGPFGKN